MSRSATVPAFPILALLSLALAAGPGIRAQEVVEETAAAVVPEALVRGHRAEVTRNGSTFQGELLAVDADTLWLLGKREPVVRIPLDEVGRLRIRRHEWDTGRALLWAGIGGLVSGSALAVACGRVEDTDCGGIIPATLAVWAVGGVIAAITFNETGRMEVDPSETDVRRFTRFPQGLPHGFGEEPPADPPPGG